MPSFEIHLGPQSTELEYVQAQYPCLLAMPREQGIDLRGTFPVKHEGKEVDSFKVLVELRECRPAVFDAEVFEIGKRIPAIPDRHVDIDRSACIALPEDIILATGGEPMALRAFLGGPVHNFFLAQAVFEREGRWPFGERGHGDAGVREFYYELLGTRDLEVAARYLALLAAPRLHRQWFCPCGSREKIRRCHGNDLERLRERVPAHVAARLRARMRGKT
jgi:hypothetical protein